MIADTAQRVPPPGDPFWQPSDRQAELLASDDFEVLYGGAAGGGKTDALLVDAMCLQHGGIWNKNHKAIIFRRTFPELADLIDRANEIYSRIDPGAIYNQAKAVWTFSSGARISFGHLNHDNDRFKYRGRAFNYIAFDELTLWATNTCYLYLFSRLRSTDRTLPRYVRSTTNPDGPGQKWVMQRFAILPEGLATRQAIEIRDEEAGTITTLYRRFIPAKLRDNPHLTGTGYREALLLLDPEERDSLLKGLWKSAKTKGAYYLTEMAQLRQQNRIRSVPHVPGFPVYTFWDLGRNDTTAIWFMQYIDRQFRFILTYENSGESFDHYAAFLQGAVLDPSRPSPTAGFVYGRHYLPHDGVNQTQQTNKKNIEILQDLLPGHAFEIVERTPYITTGINQTRLKMRGDVLMDAENCSDGIAALDFYKKRYIEKIDAYADEPVHDRYSNYADAFRQWGQGFMPSLQDNNPRATAAKARRKAGKRPSGMAV